MYQHYDDGDDLYETVTDYKPCTACNGNLKKCNGQCNGSMSIGKKLRSKEEVAKIKNDRRIKEEDDILAQAELIKKARGLT